MNANKFREVRRHIQETGHRDTKAVVCECGRKYKGSTSGGYYHHRISHHGDKPVPKEGLKVTEGVGGGDREARDGGSAEEAAVEQELAQAIVYHVEETEGGYGEQATVGHVGIYDESGGQNDHTICPSLYNLSGIVRRFSSSVLSAYNSTLFIILALVFLSHFYLFQF